MSPAQGQFSVLPKAKAEIVNKVNPESQGRRVPYLPLWGAPRKYSEGGSDWRAVGGWGWC